MKNENSIKWLKETLKETDFMYEQMENAVEDGIKALELLDTLTDRPCSVCRHHKERTEQEVGGCCKWDCVFDGHIGGK